MTEPRDVKIKRLHMRSIRRGIKEMDLILTAYATKHMPNLSDDGLALYDDLLAENDHDLYSWILGTAPTPGPYLDMMTTIAAGAEGLTKPE